MKHLTACLILVITLLPFYGKGQGCIAVRHMSCATTVSTDTTSPHWELSFGYRYLKSDRHFRGTHEESDRQEENTEVINKTHSLDITATYAFNRRWSMSATLPLVHSSRSSLYEHDRMNRFTTRAYGIGDIRVTGYYRILDPVKYMNRNVVLGMGFKAPTGPDGFTDVFYTDNGPQERPVDQSIQPGDGGWGANLELQFYSEIVKNFGAYANGFYLFNPMNTNGVRTYRDSLSSLLANEAIMSITDQYMVRGGAYYQNAKTGLTFNAGVRMEGVPVSDAFGKSEGFRRPGYTVSIEPGINFRRNHNMLEINVPVALIRNRQQSITDKEIEQQTGRSRHGDAAFADYLLLITYSRKFF